MTAVEREAVGARQTRSGGVAVLNSVFVAYIPQVDPTLDEPITIRGRCAFPRETPGRGIVFNPEALERFITWQNESSSLPAHQPA